MLIPSSPPVAVESNESDQKCCNPFSNRYVPLGAVLSKSKDTFYRLYFRTLGCLAEWLRQFSERLLDWRTRLSGRYFEAQGAYYWGLDGRGGPPIKIYIKGPLS